MQTAPKTILVADDEPQVRTLVAAILTRRGYHVIVAADGVEAVAAARAHSGKIDLLLLDILMPGLNGVEVASQLLLERADAKVLLVSGMANGAMVPNGWRFLPKPFSPVSLHETVAALLDAASDGDGRVRTASS